MEILGEICEAISIRPQAQVPPCVVLKVSLRGLEGAEWPK